MPDTIKRSQRARPARAQAQERLNKPVDLTAPPRDFDAWFIEAAGPWSTINMIGTLPLGSANVEQHNADLDGFIARDFGFLSADSHYAQGGRS